MKRKAQKGRSAMPSLPTEDEARLENIAWFSRLSPSQKIQSIEEDLQFRERISGFRIRKASDET